MVLWNNRIVILSSDNQVIQCMPNQSLIRGSYLTTESISFLPIPVYSLVSHSSGLQSCVSQFRCQEWLFFLWYSFFFFLNFNNVKLCQLLWSVRVHLCVDLIECVMVHSWCLLNVLWYSWCCTLSSTDHKSYFCVCVCILLTAKITSLHEFEALISVL